MEEINRIANVVGSICVIAIITIPVLIGLLMLPYYISKWRKFRK